MNITLWLLQALLSLAYLAHGFMFLFPSPELAALMDASIWKPFRLFLGVAEVAAGIGLVVPGVTRIKPWLVPLAAALLLGRIDADGLGRTKLQVLEALLRLRQAASHPGLVNPAHAGLPSAKLDVLIPRLEELVEDGRKVLVFSQFTTMLGLLRTRLDASGLSYEYLDGRTRDRQARVDRFQSDAGPPIFLISLKAGGVGLNLTAADHVFLLDPWWNPAVEAQAIDRAHRIGQSRHVFAVRLIARDTVEEKVLELQASKRSLADAIVRADERLIRDLRREDLELLLA